MVHVLYFSFNAGLFIFTLRLKKMIFPHERHFLKEKWNKSFLIALTVITLSINSFAEEIHHKDMALPVSRVEKIIAECEGIGVRDTVNLTAQFSEPKTKVSWSIPERYLLHFSMKATSDNKARLEAGSYAGGSVDFVPVKACPFGSISEKCCAVI